MDERVQGEGEKSGRVKASILVPFAVVLSIVIGTFLTFVYLYMQQERERELGRLVKAVERSFLKETEKDTDLMRAILESITRNDDAKAAFLRRDRRALMREVMPLFDGLRSSHRVSRFYVTTPDHVIFLRAHQPDRFGDTIGRFTTLEAEWTGQGAHGIELGPFGNLTVRSVIPWRDGNRLIGFLELGEDIEHVIRDVRRIFGVDVLMLVYKRYLDREQWETGMRTLGREGDWDRYQISVGVGRTMKEVPEALARSLGTHEQHRYGTVIPLSKGGRYLYVAFLPLMDVGDREIGDLVVIRDVSRLQAAFRDSLALIVSLCLFVGAEAFIFFYYVLNRVELEHRRHRQVEMQFSKLSAEHQKIVQTEKLSAVGLMIGEIAHQINNPLVGVINIAQLAERDAENPARMRELLREIRKAGEGCRDFVRRMLEFTRISRFDRKPTDMVELIRETVTLFHQTTNDCPEVEIDLPSTPVVLDVDPVLIRHALFNLLANAAQAQTNKQGARITIRLAPEPRDGDHTPGWCLSVIDRGPGLSEEIREKVFTPFFSTRSEGTGLGLPVVQQIATSHEGRITAANIPGGGARFALWLPDAGTNWGGKNEAEDTHRR